VALYFPDAGLARRDHFGSRTVVVHGSRVSDRIPEHRAVGRHDRNPRVEFLAQPLDERINGIKGNMDDLVERCLRQAALWDEVKDKLQESVLALSGGQQQRLCIARTLAINPDVILMDEPASALDPISTLKIEDLMRELERQYTIVVVTHNMQQAARVSDQTIFFSLDEHRQGVLIEAGRTRDMFTNPRDQRTEDYITGRFG